MRTWPLCCASVRPEPPTTVVSVPDIIGTTDLQRLAGGPRRIRRTASAHAAPTIEGCRDRHPIPRLGGAALGAVAAARRSRGGRRSAPRRRGRGRAARAARGFRILGYAHRTPVAIEYPFATTIAGQPTSGRIDAVYRTPEAGRLSIGRPTGPRLPMSCSWPSTASRGHTSTAFPGGGYGGLLHVRRGDRVVPTLPDEAGWAPCSLPRRVDAPATGNRHGTAAATQRGAPPVGPPARRRRRPRPGSVERAPNQSSIR